MAKKKRRSSRSKVKSKVARSPRKTSGALKNVFLFLAGSGLLVFAAESGYSYWKGSVSIDYVKPTGRSYEFVITNDSPVEHVIESFRVYPDLDQSLIFTITEDVIATFDENGVDLPGGNETYIPAFEFKELDGFTIDGGSRKSFRVPPLSARSYYKPEAMLVFTEYQAYPSNKLLRTLERAFRFLGFGSSTKKNKYLVSGDFWSPVPLDQEVSALDSACRDTEWFSKSSECTNK